jgi:tRNA threonylcarbamoyladenosine biosynthesis protein TsaE
MSWPIWAPPGALREIVDSFPGVPSGPIAVGDARATFLAHPEATHALGVVLGGAISPGDVIALVGPLGAGKTTLVQGIGEAVGVPSNVAVNSPTFAVCAEYPSHPALLHVDLYRLESADEAEAIGLPERLGEPGTLAVVEWADKIPEILPPHTLWIRLEAQGAGRRVLLWEGDGGDVSWAEAIQLGPDGGTQWTTTPTPTLGALSS